MSLAQKPWGLILLSVLCVGFGLGPQAIFMVCNFTQGLTWGHDETGRYVFSYGALFFDVAFVAASIMRGHFLRIGERWKAISCIGPIAFCGGMSLLMFYGFAASNQIEPGRMAALEQAAALNAAQQSNAMTAAAKAQLMAFLQKETSRLADEARKKNLTTDQRAAIQSDQKSYLEKMEQATSIEVKATPVDKSSAASATVARTFGLEGTSFQQVYLAIFGIGMLWVSSFMIRKGVMIWPKAAPAASEPVPPSAMDRELPANVEKLLSAPEQVRKFFRENTRSNPDAEVVAADMHRAYAEWAASKHYRPILSSQGFGVAANNLRVAGEIDIGRHHRGGNVRYTGRVPFNLKTEPRAPTVKRTLGRGVGRPKTEPVAPMRLASSGIVH